MARLLSVRTRDIRLFDERAAPSIPAANPVGHQDVFSDPSASTRRRSALAPDSPAAGPASESASNRAGGRAEDERPIDRWPVHLLKSLVREWCAARRASGSTLVGQAGAHEPARASACRWLLLNDDRTLASLRTAPTALDQRRLRAGGPQLGARRGGGGGSPRPRLAHALVRREGGSQLAEGVFDP